MRRSQISLFVIIGLVIILITGFILVKISSVKKEELSSSQEPLISNKIFRERVDSYVSDCLDAVSEELITKIALKGGYLKDAPLYFESKDGDFSYLMFLDHDFIPKNEDVEKQLEREIHKQLLYCVQSYEDLEKSGFDIEHGGINIEVQLNDETVVIILTYNILIEGQAENIIEFNEFTTTISKRLGKLLILAKEIVDLQLNDISQINPSYFESKEQEYDLQIYVYPTDNDRTYVYSIIDQLTDINFQFAVRFKLGEVPTFK